MIDLDILADFQKEAKQLLEELTEVVEQLEETQKEFPSTQLETFSQRIDRIMGAAKTLGMLAPDHMGLKRIAAIAEICKKLGYKASEFRATPLIPIFSAFWADTIEVMSDLVDSVGDEKKSEEIAKSFSSVVQNRLVWLSEKLQQHAPAAKPGNEIKSQLDIDNLLELMNK